MTKNQHPRRPFNKQKKLLELLKTVSRSFYLSIRILPGKVRHAIALAYLLARAADSIADSEHQDIKVKQNLLYQLQNLLSSFHELALSEFIEQALPILTVREEQVLIKELTLIFSSIHCLSEEEQSLISKTVNTLIQGMHKDMSMFGDTEQISALKTDPELDEYTYLVAGCVGEFWTEILQLHYTLSWDSTQQIKNGILFGKALQLTNILRDIRKDALIGRCYIPLDELKKNNLKPGDLLDSTKNKFTKPVKDKYIRRSLDYYHNAEQYLLNTPRTTPRLRMASFWPIAIGMQTLAKINSNNNSAEEVKVRRKQVYLLMLLSPVLLWSNTLTKCYLEKLRQKIE